MYTSGYWSVLRPSLTIPSLTWGVTWGYIPWIIRWHRYQGNNTKDGWINCMNAMGTALPKASDAERWANNRDAGGLRHHRSHCDVTVMEKSRLTIHTFHYELNRYHRQYNSLIVCNRDSRDSMKGQHTSTCISRTSCSACIKLIVLL